MPWWLWLLSFILMLALLRVANVHPRWKIGAYIGIAVVAFSAWGLNHNVYKPQSIRNDFLSFIPQNESGAPHDMEYIIEAEAGDAGYYGTSYFPGTLSVTGPSNGYYNIDWKINNMDFQFEMTSDGQNIKPTNAISSMAMMDATGN